MIHDGSTRRDLLLGFAGSATLLVPRPLLALAAGRRLTPEMFGARGDGRTDDYDALLRMAAAASGSRGTTILFGRNRRYRIDRVRLTRGPRKNDVANIVFRNCAGLVVDLNGSVVDVKGDFHRSADRRNRRHVFSFLHQVEPFVFEECAGLMVGNGSLTGNADRTTRDEGVVEGSGRGIRLQGCSDVTLQDLHIHRFVTDGIQIYPNSRGEVSRNIRLLRVRSTNNARQGLSNSGGAGVTAVDCEFSENGVTGGTYRHAPGAGVDVEPNRSHAIRSDFSALRCRFDNNAGCPVVAGNPDHDSFVELIDCSGTCSSFRRMIFGAERSLVRGGSWHNVQIACSYGIHRQFDHDIAVEVTDGTWTGDDPAWAPVYDLHPRRPRVHIHGNRFELNARSPMKKTYLFRCANPNHRFENNDVFVARAGHDGAGDDLVGQFDNAHVRFNRWRTDAAPPLRFVNNYRNASVSGESFAGSFASL